MVIKFLKFTKLYFAFSGILVILSILAILIYGLNWGIDFVGGSMIQAKYIEEPTTLTQDLEDLGLENFSIRLNQGNIIALRMPDSDQELKDKVNDYFYNSEVIDSNSISFESISPIVGGETKAKALKAIIYSVIAIILYVAFVFRKVSRPIKSWKYGIATVIALIHDVIIPIGIFAALGHFYNVEFSIPILTALLTIFGYSVNDTVVVFDRIRENLGKHHGHNFKEIVNESLNQTLIRSLNTSLTTLLVLFAIYFFGGISLNFFSLALIFGVIAGTYSSMFLASTLLVEWSNRKTS
jgi:preprotein translocase subunit SecF